MHYNCKLIRKRLMNMHLRIIARSVSCRPLFNRCLSVAARANEHDFVVVGAGSAGCILTNRLSAAGNDVCLIEAGASDNNDTVRMPMGWSDLFYNKAYNWDYWTEPQTQSANRRFYWPRGKTLGGTSSINCMVYMRPHPLDLERWVNEENAKGWSYAETLPYFKRIETYHPSDDYPKEQLPVYRGSSGPIHITSGKLRSKDHPDREFYEAIVEAGKQFGLPYTHDPCGYQQEGIFWTDSNSYKGMRMSTSVTYLKSACESNAKHVQVRTNLLCTKLLFDDSKKRVIGVEAADVNDHTKVTRVYARRDVIVSAGAINSPQLLLLSGIGDANHLKQLGIKPVVNLPGVGQNLQDHIRFEIVLETRPLVVSRMSDPDYLKKVLSEWSCSKTGLASLTGIDVGAHFRTTDQFEHPNVQTAFSARIFENDESGTFRLSGKSGLTILPCTQREFSRGFVKLKSANPFDHPIIDPQLFTDPRDLIELVDAFKICRNIARQKALVPHLKSETTPGPSVKTDKEIEKYLQNTSFTSYHPCGSCKMGDIQKDPMAVVDSKSMNVFGVDGLRVVDASVMPSLPSCNLNAPTMMIAEKTCDSILGQNLPPEDAPFYRGKVNYL